MRKLLIAAMTALLMALTVPAFAGPGPAGTSESDDDPTTAAAENNQVDCGEATVPNPTGSGAQVNAAGDPATGGGIVVCNDDASAPIQGRVIIAGSASGGYVAADGDADNSAEAQGFLRVDVNGTTPGPTCGDTANGETDSAAGPGTGECG